MRWYAIVSLKVSVVTGPIRVIADSRGDAEIIARFEAERRWRLDERRRFDTTGAEPDVLEVELVQAAADDDGE